MTTIELDGTVIAAARSSLSGLASRAESQAQSAAGNTPVECGLPGSDIPKAVEWIRSQDAELQYVEDLAFILEKSGKASFEVSSGSLSDLKQAMIDQLADKLGDLDDMDNIEDREEMERIAEIMGHYTDDTTVSEPLVERMGPEGLVTAMYHMQSWIGDDMMPNYRGEVLEDFNGEREKIQALQDSLATSLAAMLGTASRQPGFDPEFGRKLVDEDGSGWALATLFDYGEEQANYRGFGKDLLVSSGEALLEREEQLGNQGSWSWSQVTGPYGKMFGTDSADDADMNDPVLQWMRALDDNPEASQEIMLDKDRMTYLLGERKSEYEDDGQAAGNVLRAATVDQALAYDPDHPVESDRQLSYNAAQISANVIDQFGEGDEALGGVDDDIGGIIATYIADVDRTAGRSDDQENGVLTGNDGLLSSMHDSGLPYYHLEIDQNDLTDLLEDVGDNDTATATIADAATRYNAVRMGGGAELSLNGPGPGDPGWEPGTAGDPLIKSVNESSALNGYLQDSMINGAIDDAEDEAAKRKEIAGLFMLPTEFIKVPGGPVGDFVVGEVKDHITEAFVGDETGDRINTGNDEWETGRDAMRLQAYYALLNASTDEDPYSALNQGENVRVEQDDRGDWRYVTGALGDTWPTENGHPKPPGDLTQDEMREILSQGEDVTGIPGQMGTEVDTTWDTLAKQYGDN